MLTRTTNVENMLASQAMSVKWYGAERKGFRCTVWIYGLKSLRVSLSSHEALVTLLRDIVIEDPTYKVSVDTWLAF